MAQRTSILIINKLEYSIVGTVWQNKFKIHKKKWDYPMSLKTQCFGNFIIYMCFVLAYT